MTTADDAYESDWRGELDQLIVLANEGELTHQQIARLKQLLESNEDAGLYYVAAMYVQAGLWRHFGSSNVSPQPERCDLPETDAERRDSRSLAPPLLGNTVYGMASYFSSGWPVAYLVATVIFGLGLLIGSFVYVSQPVQVVRQPAPLPSPSSTTHYPLSTTHSVVGRITGMVDCKWESSIHPSSFIPHPSSPVSLGDKYALSSGLMEITYDSGAKVILQGPCTYEVESKDGGYLSVGKLTAKLEKKPNSPLPSDGGHHEVVGAGGEGGEPSLHPSSFILHPLFSVRTPTAIVTDLGTEFGVEVGEAGVTLAHVFRGVVEVQLAADDGRQGRTIRLTENEAVRVEKPGGSEVDAMLRVTADPDAFVRSEQLFKIARQRQGKTVRTPPLRWPIYDKTFVAWVSLANTEQQGVGVMSLVNMPEWDGIVFGELERGKWMAGSDGYARTQKEQVQSALETARPGQLVQIVLTCGAPNITIYRNGEKYAEYPCSDQIVFNEQSIILIGKRLQYEGAFPVPTLVGAVEEARLYNRVLSPEMIASLKPNEPSAISPVGCWTFEDDTARDVTGHFPMGELHGNAHIADGKLILDGANSYLLVPATVKHDKQAAAEVKDRGAADTLGLELSSRPSPELGDGSTAATLTLESRVENDEHPIKQGETPAASLSTEN